MNHLVLVPNPGLLAHLNQPYQQHMLSVSASGNHTPINGMGGDIIPLLRCALVIVVGWSERFDEKVWHFQSQYILTMQSCFIHLPCSQTMVGPDSSSYYTVSIMLHAMTFYLLDILCSHQRLVVIYLQELYVCSEC